MNKTRVYELAQKLGVDNKEIIARLKSIGVEVKNHMAVIDDETAEKISADVEPKEVSQEEIRVKPTLIRRRPKTIEEPAEVKLEAEVVHEAAELESLEKKKKKPAAEITKVEEIEEVPESEEEVVSEKAVEVPPVSAKEQQVGKATMTKARILGRVEIPQPSYVAKPQDRQPERPVRQKEEPKKRVAAPQITEAPAVEVTVVDERRKGKKVKEIQVEEVEKTAKKGGFTGKKKDGLKKLDIIEKRERVFEPAPRSAKGKRKEREKEQVGKKTEITVPKAIKRIIKISESITVGELAKRMGTKANDLIRALMKMGFMATINHPLDYDTASIIATDFGYEIENVAIDLDEMIETAAPDAPENLVKRPPVVTIMGHVDHGKTSLLDAIRETNVIAGEAGGITQHIGAYDVELKGRKITFLDTPGHAAFTAMRARGAKVTDIVILVVAADDGVMPQTREAINHSKAAGVPIIVAINKIDKPEAKPEKIKQELTEFGLVPEDWGGETIFVDVSAKKRINLEELLEMVLLQADVMELRANPDKPARGTIVEAKLDRGRGPVATVLVQEGTLQVGDSFVSGIHYGKVRAMQNERGTKLSMAGPSMPAEVIGFTGVPDAGDLFVVLADEKQAKEIAMYRQQKMRETELAKSSKLSLEQLYEKIQKGEVKELNVVIKGDVQGSVEAVSESLRKLSTDAIRLVVIHSSVGAINETDVNLASASNAIVLGFNVRPEVKAQTLAEKEGVDIRLYNIIYDAVDDIKKAMEGLLEPTLREKLLGHAEIREVFSVPKHGNVAGSFVLDGKMVRNMPVRLLRDNVVIYEGKMASLRRFKDDVKEVASGYECGISLENYNDIKVGDIIEAYEIEKIAAKL
jgi:translation initiation factor IF-2